MVPEGWNSSRLSKLVVKDRKIRYGIIQPGEYDATGRFLVRGRDYSKGWAIPESLFRVSDPIEIPYAKARVKSGDIILTIVGAGTGNVSIVPAWLDGANITQTTARIAIDEKKIDPDYCYHYLLSQSGRKLVYKYIKGGAQPGLNIRDVEKFTVTFPAHSEQHKIAEILSTWDKAIGQVDKLIEANEKLKKGLMQQLLTGKRRFPGFEGKWEEVRLGNVFTERNDLEREDLRLLSITASRGVIDRDEVDRKDTSTADKSKYKRIVPGDIGYNTMRMWQGVSALSSLEGIVSPAYTIVIPGPRIHSVFASHLFKLPRIVNLFYRYSQGLVDDTRNLKYHNFAQIKVKIPNVDEQERIAGALTEVDSTLAKLDQFRESLSAQKVGLMQVLLIGKKRVKTKGAI